MRGHLIKLFIAYSLIFSAFTFIGFTYSGDGANGFSSKEKFTYQNGNEVDAALDALEAFDPAHSTTISATNEIVKFTGTAGDIQRSGVLIDSSNNVTIPGTATIGTGTGATCLIGRNHTNTGNVSCRIVSLVLTCEVDTNGVCGDGT